MSDVVGFICHRLAWYRWFIVSDLVDVSAFVIDLADVSGFIYH